MTKSILEGVQRPKDLVEGRRNHPLPLRMLRHSQARSSSMDLLASGQDLPFCQREKCLGQASSDAMKNKERGLSIDKPL
ncbi:MAG: hypothetical protein FWF18_04435 [Dehalococcoidia bacterium]|nr:hypothetical protein [Dehalococcoidia bacterium]